MKTSQLTRSTVTRSTVTRSTVTRSTVTRSTVTLGIASLALLLSLGACRKDEKKADTKAPADTAASTSKKVKAADEGVEVPTEEDFEDAVAKQITPDSDLQKELDQLDREINGTK
jgi:hypothetical protein